MNVAGITDNRRRYRRYRYGLGIIGAWIALMVLLACRYEVFAQQPISDRASILNETEQTIQGLLLWQCERYGVADTQELLDSVYAADAANGVTLSYVIGLCGNAKEASPYDFQQYKAALQEALRTPEELAPATLQKSVIVLALLNGEHPLDENSLCETIGQGGIMTYIYGLMMLEAQDMQDAAISTQQVIDKLLEEQLADGGFSIMGAEGDVDVTAMALQAMAPCYLGEMEGISGESLEKVRQSVERALAFLSQAQLADGSYESYGSKSSESTSQVILALCALNKDLFLEEAFVKNGNTPYHGLMQYRCNGGGFSHTPEAEVNDMATAQAFCALSALRVSLGGENPDIYTVYSAAQGRNTDYRVILAVLLLVLAAGYAGFMGIRKRMSKKRLVGILLAVGVGLGLIFCLHMQTREEYKSGGTDNGQVRTIQVTAEIRCDTVAGRTDDIPKDGVMLERTEIEVPEGASAFTVLQEACRQFDIQLEYKGAVKGFAYVEGIGYLYEYDFGELSGWMYQVNGEFPSVGSGEYIVKENDRIVWVYTLELGKDLDAGGAGAGEDGDGDETD